MSCNPMMPSYGVVRSNSSVGWVVWPRSASWPAGWGGLISERLGPLGLQRLANGYMLRPSCQHAGEVVATQSLVEDKTCPLVSGEHNKRSLLRQSEAAAAMLEHLYLPPRYW